MGLVKKGFSKILRIIVILTLYVFFLSSSLKSDEPPFQVITCSFKDNLTLNNLSLSINLPDSVRKKLGLLKSAEIFLFFTEFRKNLKYLKPDSNDIIIFTGENNICYSVQLRTAGPRQHPKLMKIYSEIQNNAKERIQEYPLIRGSIINSKNIFKETNNDSFLYIKILKPQKLKQRYQNLYYAKFDPSSKYNNMNIGLESDTISIESFKRIFYTKKDKQRQDEIITMNKANISDSIMFTTKSQIILETTQLENIDTLYQYKNKKYKIIDVYAEEGKLPKKIPLFNADGISIGSVLIHSDTEKIDRVFAPFDEKGRQVELKFGRILGGVFITIASLALTALFLL